MVTQEEFNYEYQKLMYEVNLWFLVSREFDLVKNKNPNPDYLVQKSTNPQIRELIGKIVDFGKFAVFGEELDIFCRRKNIDDINRFLLDPTQNESYILIDGEVFPLKPQITLTPEHIDYYKYFLYFVIKHCKPIELPHLLNYQAIRYFSNKVDEFLKILREIRKNHPSAKYWVYEHTYKEIGKWLYHISKDVADKGLFFELSDEFQANKTKIIRNLYDELTKNGFIEKTRDSFLSFQYVFGEFDEIRYHTINWVGSFSELKYLIQTMKSKKMISPSKIWLTCSYCILHNGEIVDDRIIGTHDMTNYMPKRVNLLDEIINKIQK